MVISYLASDPQETSNLWEIINSGKRVRKEALLCELIVPICLHKTDHAFSEEKPVVVWNSKQPYSPEK